jgi:small nuclear ribonucleoprotein E
LRTRDTATLKPCQQTARDIILRQPHDFLNISNMSGRGGHGGGGGGRKVLLPPINFIFKLLQQHSTVQIWLYEQLNMRIEGKIRGFDEFMNLVIDDAVEVTMPSTKGENASEGGERRHVGQCGIRIA